MSGTQSKELLRTVANQMEDDQVGAVGSSTPVDVAKSLS